MNDIHSVIPDIAFDFELKNPALEECYAEGYYAAQQELDESDNPYQEGTSAFSYWQDGWWDGFYVTEPLFEKEVENMGEAEKLEDAANQSQYPTRFLNSNVILKVVEITSLILGVVYVGMQLVDLAA